METSPTKFAQMVLASISMKEHGSIVSCVVDPADVANLINKSDSFRRKNGGVTNAMKVYQKIMKDVLNGYIPICGENIPVRALMNITIKFMSDINKVPYWSSHDLFISVTDGVHTWPLVFDDCYRIPGKGWRIGYQIEQFRKM